MLIRIVVSFIAVAAMIGISYKSLLIGISVGVSFSIGDYCNNHLGDILSYKAYLLPVNLFF